MAQALCGRGSLLWDQLQHGKQEVSEALGFFTGPLVLVNQHLQQAPRLQLGDVFQITFLGEKILGIFAVHYEFAWDAPQQLNDQRYMVYKGRRLQEERGRQRQDKQQICQTVSQSQAHSGCVCVEG